MGRWRSSACGEVGGVAGDCCIVEITGEEAFIGAKEMTRGRHGIYVVEIVAHSLEVSTRGGRAASVGVGGTLVVEMWIVRMEKEMGRIWSCLQGR